MSRRHSRRSIRLEGYDYGIFMIKEGEFKNTFHNGCTENCRGTLHVPLQWGIYSCHYDFGDCSGNRGDTKDIYDRYDLNM
ncbi:MAG: hypothetical protein SVY10_05755, partial [Thermodesulfobacteriota bacterium]|nr:hypothetical protein [Thermodesulfobacteriota bacterium]